MSSKTCALCCEPILETDEDVEGLNFVAHLECEFRHVVGSVGHQMKHCTCFGGTEDDPPGMTKREAAKAAWDFYHEHNQKPQNRSLQ